MNHILGDTLKAKSSSIADDSLINTGPVESENPFAVIHVLVDIKHFLPFRDSARTCVTHNFFATRTRDNYMQGCCFGHRQMHIFGRVAHQDSSCRV